MAGPDLFQTDVARIALTAAKAHGFALAGGHALIAHGVIVRATEDVDLFTDEAGGVRAAAELVTAALTEAGMSVADIPQTTEMGEVFYGFENDMAEFEVRHGDQVVLLQLVRFDRGRSPDRPGPASRRRDRIQGRRPRYPGRTPRLRRRRGRARPLRPA